MKDVVQQEDEREYWEKVQKGGSYLITPVSHSSTNERLPEDVKEEDELSGFRIARNF
jgi:hypothetical protein